jgi:orotidine-5'-phosphate decarboxylase
LRPATARDRLIAALDLPGPEEALATAAPLADLVGMFKVGLELFSAGGPSIVRSLVQSRPVFLDLKLNDIPNTMSAAAQQAALLGVSMLTVHATAGSKGIEAAVAGAALGARPGKPPPAVLAVTVLTSLDDLSLKELGFQQSPLELALSWARLALRAGASGLVCSVHEIAPLRQAIGAEPLLVVPGIRPVGTDAGDQRRTGTPGEAVRAGADYLVIGRPLRQSGDPRAAAQAISAEIDAALRAHPAQS